MTSDVIFTMALSLFLEEKLASACNKNGSSFGDAFLESGNFCITKRFRYLARNIMKRRPDDGFLPFFYVLEVFTRTFKPNFSAPNCSEQCIKRKIFILYR